MQPFAVLYPRSHFVLSAAGKCVVSSAPEPTTNGQPSSPSRRQHVRETTLTGDDFVRAERISEHFTVISGPMSDCQSITYPAAPSSLIPVPTWKNESSTRAHMSCVSFATCTITRSALPKLKLMSSEDPSVD